jgi:hypothetical protein
MRLANKRPALVGSKTLPKFNKSNSIFSFAQQKLENNYYDSKSVFVISCFNAKVAGVKVYLRQTSNLRSHAVSASLSL